MHMADGMISPVVGATMYALSGFACRLFDNKTTKRRRF